MPVNAANCHRTLPHAAPARTMSGSITVVGPAPVRCPPTSATTKNTWTMPKRTPGSSRNLAMEGAASLVLVNTPTLVVMRPSNRVTGPPGALLTES